MKHFYDESYVLGILGGGQLGRMLIQETVNFNVSTIVLDPDPHAPCRNLCNNFIQGDLKDFDTVYRFGKDADIVTIEFEHINTEALEALVKEGVKVFPQPEVIRIVQDKGLQKEFYRKHNIPTADFILIGSRAELEKNAGFLPCYQKLRKSGYDGKGVVRINSLSDLPKSFDGPSVLEKYVDFAKEISVIVARSESGEVKTFPVVELLFNPEANLVEYLFSPADIPEKASIEATEIAIRIAESLNIVGILAVELFLTRDDRILVNEIAPRPHNSGHQSIEGNITSQYEQHLRAILNLPLGSTDIICPSVMVNLLGEKGHEGPACYEGLEKILSVEGVKLHLYGKKYTKPFRKMGHVTIVDGNLDKAREKARIVKEFLKITASA